MTKYERAKVLGLRAKQINSGSDIFVEVPPNIFDGYTIAQIELEQKKIPLLEDVCESHGANFNNKKLGSFGLISNFSFYYAHHLSTIEGGMLYTYDPKIYEIALMMRGR